MPNTAITNPFSSGGGGTAFEQRVAACYLVSMLREEIPRGLNAGTAYRLRMQARQTGVLLDDLLITSFDGATTRHLALQVKHKLAFSSDNSMLREVMAAAWSTYQSAEGWEFHREQDRLGIGLGKMPDAVREHLLPVLEWARACLTADEFLSKVATPYFSHQQKQRYVTLFRETLDDVAEKPLEDGEFWQFLRHLVVLDFDVEYEGGRDATVAWNALLDLAPNRDSSLARDAFEILISKAGEWVPKAATVDVSRVAEAVKSTLALSSETRVRADFHRLEAHSRSVLRRMRDNLADAYYLPRSDVVEHAWTALQEADVVFITGEPGSGKSGVLRSLVRRLESETQVLLVRADELDYPMLENFTLALGLRHSLDELLGGLSAAPIRCLMIDGLERALSLERKGCLHGLVDAIVARNEQLRLQGISSELHWKIVCTCRANVIESVVTELQPLATASLTGKFRMVPVGPLTDEEMQEVMAAFPAVRALWAASHLRNLLRQPLTLDILTRQRIPLVTTKATARIGTNDIATETWFADQFWTIVVCRNDGAREGIGNALSREQSLLEIAERSLEHGWNSVPIQGFDPDAIEGLMRDQVLIKQDATLAFAHDVFGDWALYKLLAQRGRDLPAFINEHQEARVLDRPIQLLACRALEQSTNTESWLRLLTAFASQKELSTRWQHLILTAPMFSAQWPELLPRLEPLLLSNDGELLDELLIALKTVATEPDSAMAMVYSGIDPEEAERILPYLRQPLVAVWTPMLTFLIHLEQAIPDKALLRASEVLQLWMEKTAPSADVPLRREVATLALSLLFAQEGPEESEDE